LFDTVVKESSGGSGIKKLPEPPEDFVGEMPERFLVTTTKQSERLFLFVPLM
jgi:hypothetical protein